MMRVIPLFKKAFSTVKQEYSRHFVIKLYFTADGYYESNQFRPDFVKMLATLEKKNEAIVLGGDSFPFGTSTFYLNCDDIETATRFANDNIFVKKGVATASVQQSERISAYKVGNVANFYQIKAEI